MTDGHLVPPEPPPGNPTMYVEDGMLYIRQDILTFIIMTDKCVCGERLTYIWGELCGKYRRRELLPTPKEEQK